MVHHGMEETSCIRDEESDERRVIETPPDLVETVRSLKVELQSYQDDNEKLIRAQEKLIELNAVLLQRLYEIQK
jgi:hypothetical protein